jgi:hypothetical protein
LLWRSTMRANKVGILTEPSGSFLAIRLEVGVGYVELAPLLGNRIVQRSDLGGLSLLARLFRRPRADQPADEREEADRYLPRWSSCAMFRSLGKAPRGRI